MIAIVDYGMGNLGSIVNMFKKIGTPVTVSSDPAVLRAASKLVLPGVGAFDTAMENLRRTGLKDVLDEIVLGLKTPTIGLCLGMQLLTEGSEEGSLPGFGWVRGETRRFRFDEAGRDLKVPHMGWNNVRPAEGKPLVHGLSRASRFYFVHSFHVTLRDDADAAAWTHYGYDFVSIIQKDHVMGTQFHPEKSHKFGMQLLRNFAGLS